MPYSAVYVFGDSLVDSGNVLELGTTIGSIPLIGAPNGTPTAAKGYFQGRFTDGFNFADVISNKLILVPTQPVFPFGYEDPLLGLTFPDGDPTGNNLNFAYGGARIVGGNVPDLDDQTDAYRDAVDKHASASALHLIAIGGNDVRKLVPETGTIAGAATAQSALQKAANEIYEEVRELI